MQTIIELLGSLLLIAHKYCPPISCLARRFHFLNCYIESCKTLLSQWQSRVDLAPKINYNLCLWVIYD